MRARDIAQTTVLLVDRIDGHPDRGDVARVELEVVVVLMRWSWMHRVGRFVEPLRLHGRGRLPDQCLRQRVPALVVGVLGKEGIVRSHVLQLLEGLGLALLLVERGALRQRRRHVADVAGDVLGQHLELLRWQEAGDLDEPVAVVGTLVVFVTFHCRCSWCYLNVVRFRYLCSLNMTSEYSESTEKRLRKTARGRSGRLLRVAIPSMAPRRREPERI